VARSISFQEFWDAVDDGAPRVVSCSVCGVPMRAPRCPDRRPGSFCLFDTCESCLDTLNGEHDAGQMTFDFTF
jgi:hypothetical protein